jgi:hypothetical protein
MQQVHEGAYDFARFTHSGHRRLWRGFEEIESGIVAGPATALVWAIEHFAGALAPHAGLRRPFRAAARLGTFWIKYFDYALASSPSAFDAACCTYFYGARRPPGQATSDREIVERYAGAQSLTHV